MDNLTPLDNPEKTDRKKILIWISIGIFLIFILAISCLLYFSMFVQEKTINDLQKDNDSLKETIQELEFEIKELNSTNDISYVNYTNTNIPGFEFTYTSDWILAENTTTNPTQFELTLTKDSTVLSLKATESQEIEGSSCTNIAIYEEIGNKWLRVHDSTGIFYTNSYVLDPTPRPDLNFLDWGQYEDEWSHIYSNDYALCITDGVLSTIRINEEYTYRFDNITISTTEASGISTQLLDEADEIVSSIQVPHEDHLAGHR